MTTDTLSDGNNGEAESTASRRAFIGRAVATGGLGGAAVVAASALETTASATSPATAEAVDAANADDKRYRESAHISRYYSLARF